MATVAPTTGRPLVNLGTVTAVSPKYTGPAAAVKAMGPGATPTAMAVGDFDADGAPDVVAGYRTAQGDVVTPRSPPTPARD